MGGALDTVGRVALFPYGVTRTAVEEVGSRLAGDDPRAFAPGAERNGLGQTREEAKTGKAAEAPVPPPPPDLTDDIVKRSRLASVRRLLTGRGLGSMFLTGPLGKGGP